MEPEPASEVRPVPKQGIAERLRDAARVEFSTRGYHGARVQGIARRAGCNVALLYRHWTSKKALYLDVLRDAWETIGRDVTARIATARGPSSVVGAYLDAHMQAPVAASTIVRELLDGGPFLSELMERVPELMAPIRNAARAIAAPGPAGEDGGLRTEVDPTVAVVSIAGLAALVASAHVSSRAVFGEPLPAELWRTSLHDLLLHGVAASGRDGG